jgi:hypothetical protein
MRVSTWIVSFAAVLAISTAAGWAESRRVELSCVNKSGENMYRAADGSVVWTASCGHESRCADATVTVGSTPNSGVIRWYGGGSCHVVNASFSRAAQSGGGKKKKTGGRP